VSDIDAAPMESLKALDPNRPIREADMADLAAKILTSFFKPCPIFVELINGNEDMPIGNFYAGAMQQTVRAAIILVTAGFGYAALTGRLDIPNDTSATIVGLAVILIWLTIIIGRAARLAITAKHKKPIGKPNIVALAVAILGAVMFFSFHGVILGANIQFLSIWIAIIGAVVVTIQWVDDYFKQQRLNGFGK
jgi:hypothetical protein